MYSLNELESQMLSQKKHKDERAVTVLKTGWKLLEQHLRINCKMDQQLHTELFYKV